MSCRRSCSRIGIATSIVTTFDIHHSTAITIFVVTPSPASFRAQHLLIIVFTIAIDDRRLVSFRVKQRNRLVLRKDCVDVEILCSEQPGRKQFLISVF